MRESERERDLGREIGVRTSGRREVSVFINNIPERLDKYGLKGIFNKASKVSDVYIPVCRRKGSGIRFGFVRFWNKYEVMKSIQILNNAIIRGCKISVSLAKYAKRQNRSIEQTTKEGKRNGVHRSSQVWRKKKHSSGESEAQAKATNRNAEAQEL